MDTLTRVKWTVGSEYLDPCEVDIVSCAYGEVPGTRGVLWWREESEDEQAADGAGAAGLAGHGRQCADT